MKGAGKRTHIPTNQWKLVIPDSALMFLGNGSYGSIYSLPEPNTNLVLKEHAIQDQTFQTCDDWEQEYSMHTRIYKTCNHILQQFMHTIVKPIHFGYAKHTDGFLSIQSIPTDASSCVILMERVFGRLPEPNPALEANLQLLLAQNTKYTTKSYIPPYLFCGSFTGPQGAITLDMLRGVEMVSFVREELTYCNLNDSAFSLCKNMVLSLFTIVGNGIIPRDIEFVVNGNQNQPPIAILDFNECKTIQQRQNSAGNDYDINEDIANVYIDLCGLRKEAAAQNPQAPYEIGTPQWKFLCSPLTSPYSFLEIMEQIHDPVHTLCKSIAGFDFKRVIHILFMYTIRYHWMPKIRTISKRYKLQEYSELTFLQYHQLYVKVSMLDTLIKKGVIRETDSDTYLKQPYDLFLEQVKLLPPPSKLNQETSFDVYSLW